MSRTISGFAGLSSVTECDRCVISFDVVYHHRECRNATEGSGRYPARSLKADASISIGQITVSYLPLLGNVDPPYAVLLHAFYDHRFGDVVRTDNQLALPFLVDGDSYFGVFHG